MLIPFGELIRKHGLQVGGVLHVGAHECEEAEAYVSEGVKDVVWLEAIPDLAEKQRRRGHQVYQIVASDTDGTVVDFQVTNNGQSSSMLPLKEHKTFYPHIVVDKVLSLATKRIDTLAKEQKLDMSLYDFLNLDIQGAELKALQGMGPLLNGFAAIYTEVNTGPLYEGCVQLNELDQFLDNCGFQRVDIRMTDNKWGDALYVRKNRLLFDIGAHRGLFANDNMDFYDRLILVDASKRLADELTQKYATNKKVTVVHAIISDEQKPVFQECTVDTVSTASTKWTEQSRFAGQPGFVWTPQPSSSTPVLTMNDMIAKYGVPTGTKIDVEGYEFNVLHSLDKYIGLLSFEWAEELLDEAIMCAWHLNMLGYKKFMIRPGDEYRFRPQPTQMYNINELIKRMNTLSPSKRDAWGMIFAL
jgi:FkbM family methyltransferase